MTISIVNHKGGTGKTTTTINLGSALTLQGHRVLLIDFDAQGSLSYSLGIADHSPTIADLLHGDESLEHVIQQRENMDILPAGSSLADSELSISRSDDRYHHLKNLISQLSGYDYILIDCPPSLSMLTINALVASESVLIPMQMDVLALRGLDSILNTVDKVKALNPDLSVIGILPVMADSRKNIHQEIIQHIQSTYMVPLFKQHIRPCVKAAEAPSFGQSVIGYAPTSSTACDYLTLAQELVETISTKLNATTQTDIIK